MLLAVVLAQLAFFISCTYAFFPFTPSWLKEQEDLRSGEARRSVNDGALGGFTLGITQRGGKTTQSPSERAAHQAVRFINKYRGRHASPEAVFDGAVAKRDNQYQVMVADDPNEAKAAGISQDGTDYSYFVQVQLGSKGQKMYLLVDTGAGSSWVMGSSCKSEACAKHNSFGPENSDTIESSDAPFSVAYGSGKVTGTLTTDTFSIAGMSFKYQFGLASTTSDDFKSFAFDGILGLSVSKGANANFLQTLGDSQKLDQNIFCIVLNRASDGRNTGEIKFGSTDADRFTGDITYTPVSKDGDWVIPLGDMSFDGKKAGVGMDSYIDTGTSFIFGSKDAVKNVHSVIPGSSTSDGITYTVPCDSSKSLVLSFSGTDFEISPRDWISPKNSNGECSSNVYGYEVVKGSWLLGDTFLKNVYSVFDKDQKRIGFAKLAGAKSGNSDSSTTSDKDTSKTSGSTPSSSTGTTPTTLSTSVIPGITSTSGSNPSATKPPMGLSGHETPAGSGTAAPTHTGSSGKGDDKSSAPENQIQKSKLALILSLVAFIVLVS